MFNIEIIDRRAKKINGIISWKGLLTIGNFQEYFYMPTDSWSLKDYETQWHEGINRLRTEKESCLITSIYTLNSDPCIEWWILYRRKDRVCVQQHLLGGRLLKRRSYNKPLFDKNTCYQYIPRRVVTFEGRDIAEWTISLTEVLRFLER
jgi:hypothetical protein